jgi:hypothetical protein
MLNAASPIDDALRVVYKLTVVRRKIKFIEGAPQHGARAVHIG